jgi:hypothetical protein
MVCGYLWPCVDRRTALLAEHRNDRLSLLMYLASCLDDALTDLPPLSEVGDLDLCPRFLGWAQSARSTSVTRLAA